MLEVFLVFRMSYIMDAATAVPVLVNNFAHRDEAAEYVKAHGGFMISALVDPNSDLPRQQSDAMMRSEMGNGS